MIGEGLLKRLFSPKAKPERRLHNRALAQWQEAAGGRTLVPLDAFDWRAVEDGSNHAFLLNVADPARPFFAYVGPVLRDEADLIGDEVPLDRVAPDSLLARFGSQFSKVLEGDGPFTADHEFVTPANYRVLCRGVLVPLSKSGSAIDHVCGWISWKSEKVVPGAGSAGGHSVH